MPCSLFLFRRALLIIRSSAGAVFRPANLLWLSPSIALVVLEVSCVMRR